MGWDRQKRRRKTAHDPTAAMLESLDRLNQEMKSFRGMPEAVRALASAVGELERVVRILSSPKPPVDPDRKADRDATVRRTAVADGAAATVPDDLPALLSDSDLMRVVGLGHSRFYLLKKQGRFRALEVRPQMVGTTRYSGLLVRRYCAGEWTEARSFGRGRR